jgi:hypothetical protein
MFTAYDCTFIRKRHSTCGVHSITHFACEGVYRVLIVVLFGKYRSILLYIAIGLASAYFHVTHVL